MRLAQVFTMFDSNRYSTEELLGRMADLVDLLRSLRKLGYTEEALRVGRGRLGIMRWCSRSILCRRRILPAW